MNTDWYITTMQANVQSLTRWITIANRWHVSHSLTFALADVMKWLANPPQDVTAAVLAEFTRVDRAVWQDIDETVDRIERKRSPHIYAWYEQYQKRISL